MKKEKKFKKIFKYISPPICGEQGTVIVYVGILILVLIGFTALAVDIGHLYVARNELQNAADAGALAGARELYVADGSAVNPGANTIARDTAMLNKSENQPVEVATAEVQRGHWSFATRHFTANENILTPPILWDRTTAEIDADTTVINAVRVVARRNTSQIPTYFARIFGRENVPVAAEAIAYLGFAGTLRPQDVTLPIAICNYAILNADGEYTCNTGRMINSGGGGGVFNTGGYTNFTQSTPDQPEPCHTADTNSMKDILVAPGGACPELTGNQFILTFNAPMGATGGEITPALAGVINCWKAKAPDNFLSDGTPGQDGIPDGPWEIVLPVIDCPGNNISNSCEQSVLRGIVTVKILWITPNGTDSHYNEIPKFFKDGTKQYQCTSYATDAERIACWNNFSTTFNLIDFNTNGNAPYNPNSYYFLPSCHYEEPKGVTGGYNSGILAKIPKLVAPPQN